MVGARRPTLTAQPRSMAWSESMVRSKLMAGFESVAGRGGWGDMGCVGGERVAGYRRWETTIIVVWRKEGRGTHTWSNVGEQRDPTCVLCGPILKTVQFEAFERPATLATLVALGNFSAAGDLTLTFHPSSRLFYTSCDFLTLRKYRFRDA